ncbi:MAG TPA: YdjY domain-containing protein [Kiritimatiellia bacterium]|nr:YdjY domain-containing protein [Kiritimatiellia bacterium]
MISFTNVRAGLALSCLMAIFTASCAVRHPVYPRIEEAASIQVLGSVRIDPDKKWMIISGFVNQVEGAIELLACGPGGKTHESMFVLLARPADIQAGLLLLGLKHGPPMEGLGMGPPIGDPVEVFVFWEHDGAEKVRPAEYFIFDYVTGRQVRHGAWIFNGSKVENGYFLANAEDSIIATYWDPWAIINLQSEAGSDDKRLMVDRQRVPPLHAPITMLIRPETSSP